MWRDSRTSEHHIGNNFFLTSQYCIDFAIYQYETATGIHLFPILNPPPSPYHPSGSSQCTSPKHPVSCIKPGLATRFIYDIIYVKNFFFNVDHFLKSLSNLLHDCFCCLCSGFLAMRHVGYSFPNQDWAHALCTGSSLNHRPPGKSLKHFNDRRIMVVNGSSKATCAKHWAQHKWSWYSLRDDWLIDYSVELLL